MKLNADQYDPHRYAYATRPRCPVCNSLKLKATAGMKPQPDGTATRYTRCEDCGHRFQIIFE